ncbi:MAG TPA: DUF4395 family protein [Gaiellaceae bacterium]|nr:DUF4395 family protein [Gaiellaceae bacterium]
MSTLICPISSQMLDKRAVRVGAGLTAALATAYAVTGLWPLLAALVADCAVRIFTSYRVGCRICTYVVPPALGRAGWGE